MVVSMSKKRPKTGKNSIFCVFRKSEFLEENVRKDKITGANDVYRNRYIAIKKNDFGVEPKKSPTTRIYNEIHSRSKCLVPFGLYGVKQP